MRSTTVGGNWIKGLLVFSCLSAMLFAAEETFPRPANVKGLQVQMVDDALKLGIQHAAINVNLTALPDLEKKPENPRLEMEGQTFVFNADYLASLDRQIKPLSDQGVVVYLILLAYPSKDPVRDGLMLHTDARADHGYHVGAFNSVTAEGRLWLRAVITFLAERWSGREAGQGKVWGWIVGNEVNSHFMWSNMGRKPITAVVDHYETAFRIIHQAVRGASPQARLYVSFDHHWSKAMSGISDEEAVPGKDFLDAFAKCVRERGDYDWHVAWHPYPEDLGNPRAWADQSVTRDESTPKITFKNLDVLPRYLEKPELLYQGKPRRIILSEQGFHTLDAADGERLQAAAYAYAWEKCQSLPTIDAFIYHRHVDHAHEGGLKLGLWKNEPGSTATPAAKKEIWTLFEKAGTEEWEAAAAAYLPVIGVKEWSEALKK